MAKKKKKAKNKKKPSFLQNAWSIICNKKDTNGEYTRAALGGMMSAALNFLAAVLCVLSAAGVFATIRQALAVDWRNGMWFSNALAILFLLVLCVTALFFALILRGCANEMEREKDKNYIVAVFSALTSFAALIVAFVSLFNKGGN